VKWETFLTKIKPGLHVRFVTNCAAGLGPLAATEHRLGVVTGTGPVDAHGRPTLLVTYAEPGDPVLKTVTVMLDYVTHVLDPVLKLVSAKKKTKARK